MPDLNQVECLSSAGLNRLRTNAGLTRFKKIKLWPLEKLQDHTHTTTTKDLLIRCQISDFSIKREILGTDFDCGMALFRKCGISVRSSQSSAQAIKFTLGLDLCVNCFIFA